MLLILMKHFIELNSRFLHKSVFWLRDRMGAYHDRI